MSQFLSRATLHIDIFYGVNKIISFFALFTDFFHTSKNKNEKGKENRKQDQKICKETKERNFK